MFVDSSGRRARLLRRTGYGLAGLAAAYMAVLGLSLMGATPFAPRTILPLPEDSPAPAAPKAPTGGLPSTPADPPGRWGAGDLGPRLVRAPPSCRVPC